MARRRGGARMLVMALNGALRHTVSRTKCGSRFSTDDHDTIERGPKPDSRAPVGGWSGRSG